MALGAAIYLVGIAIYASNNVAIPMALLSNNWYAAASEAQRSTLAAAGEAMLARGEDFTPGSLVGFHTENSGSHHFIRHVAQQGLQQSERLRRYHCVYTPDALHALGHSHLHNGTVVLLL